MSLPESLKADLSKLRGRVPTHAEATAILAGCEAALVTVDDGQRPLNEYTWPFDSIPGTPDDATLFSMLAYKSEGKDRQIIIREERWINGFDSGNLVGSIGRVRWSNCSPEVQIAATGSVPELLGRLAACAQKRGQMSMTNVVCELLDAIGITSQARRVAIGSSPMPRGTANRIRKLMACGTDSLLNVSQLAWEDESQFNLYALALTKIDPSQLTEQQQAQVETALMVNEAMLFTLRNSKRVWDERPAQKSKTKR